jgi:hypothetical protein
MFLLWRSSGDERQIASLRPEFPTDQHVLRYLLRILGTHFGPLLVSLIHYPLHVDMAVRSVDRLVGGYNILMYHE